MNTPTLNYEQHLRSDNLWALREGSLHFEKQSAVQNTLQNICKKLDELAVPYAVMGGMALFFHGYRRFTEDVDILIDKASLLRLQEQLIGRGYFPPFEGSKNLRDTETGVKIEFVISGDYPGDGKPKPISFPKPETVSTTLEGMKFLGLPVLVELKLASGMTNPRRGRDLADVQELIHILGLSESFTAQLHPFVQSKFLELLEIVRENPE